MVIATRANNGYGLEDSSTIWTPITSLAAGAVPPTPATVGYFRVYQYTINDDSVFTSYVPEDYEIGTTISLVIRWACNETYAFGNGEVRWRLDWETVANDMSQVIGAGTTGNGNSGDVDIPAGARQLTETTVSTIAAASLAKGDTIGVMISRIALGAGANPTAEPEIVAAYLGYTRFVAINR